MYGSHIPREKSILKSPSTLDRKPISHIYSLYYKTRQLHNPTYLFQKYSISNVAFFLMSKRKYRNFKSYSNALQFFILLST